MKIFFAWHLLILLAGILLRDGVLITFGAMGLLNELALKIEIDEPETFKA